jgi:hypothetical protein
MIICREGRICSGLVSKYKSIGSFKKQYKDKDLINDIDFTLVPEIQIHDEVNNNFLERRRKSLAFVDDSNDEDNLDNLPPRKRYRREFEKYYVSNLEVSNAKIQTVSQQT